MSNREYKAYSEQSATMITCSKFLINSSITYKGGNVCKQEVKYAIATCSLGD